MTHDGAPRYQHVQPGTACYDSVYRDAIDYLNGAILQMSSCPNLYTTKTTARELQKTAECLAILKLEEQLFRQASPSWRDQFSERELVTQRQALLKLKEKFSNSGGQFLQRYRVNMDHGYVTCTSEKCASTELSKRVDQDDGIGWTDTSVRAAHAWAEKELSGLNSELKPLALAAQVRIRRYSDVIDITDRFSGYRRNLGYMHKRDLAAETISAEANRRPPIAPRWHLGSDWVLADAVGTQNYTTPAEEAGCDAVDNQMIQRRVVDLDPREMAGIVLRYPGKSEYQDEYLPPDHVETGMNTTLPPTTHRATHEQPKGVRGRGSMVGIDPAQVQIKNYIVNPTPNYLDEFDPRSKENKEKDIKLPNSETHDRFTWPEMPKPMQLSLPME